MRKRLLTYARNALFGVAGVIGVGLLLPQHAHALFGFGDIVFDPTSYATLGHIWTQDISNYAKLIETVTQLEKIYANGMQMYNISLANFSQEAMVSSEESAVPEPNSSIYLALGTVALVLFSYLNCAHRR